MASPSRKRLLPKPGAKTAIAALVLGMLGQDALDRLNGPLSRLAYGTQEKLFTDGSPTYRLLHDLYGYVMPAYTAILGVAVVAVPLLIAARVFARRRVRSGRPDPLDKARAFVSTRKWLAFVPGALFSGLMATAGVLSWVHVGSAWEGLMRALPGAVASFAGFYLATRAGMRAVVLPTIDSEDAAAEGMRIRDDEISFSAVAVTPETKAAVVAVAFAPQIITVLVASLRMSPSLGWLVLAYAGVISAAIAAFSRASRVAVGIDGILVRGTSRRRFFSYREIEGARVRGSDLEVLRGGKVVLRLQLHGADAARVGAVLARIEANVARVGAGRGTADQGLVETHTAEQIARAVAGAVDFRQPTISRDALWDLVEGPTVDAKTRKAAAKALVKTAAGDDHARLRVAASKCADPRVRVALERIGEGDEAVEAAEVAPQPAMGRRAALGRP